MMPLRREVQEYLRACEHLMYAMHESSLSDEEREMVDYYTNEVFQRLDFHSEKKTEAAIS